MAPGAGRFAPSPSADLHIGNLRTAALAWLFARSTGRRFLMRVEDLDDRTHTDIADRQLDDLAAIGLTWDEPAEWQSQHPQRYDAVVDELAGRDLLYECYCSRRDIAQAPRAPHAPQGAYPGTCRDLTEAERETRRRETGRPPALRLRTDAITYTVHDLLHGEYTGIVDDFVVRRGDGVAAYNLAVVVDDAAQGVDQVVRGDDLLSSSPRQAYLARLLGYPEPDVCARRVGPQRGRGTTGQARRRRDARRDRGTAGIGADRRIVGLSRHDPRADARAVQTRCAATGTVDLRARLSRTLGRSPSSC